VPGFARDRMPARQDPARYNSCQPPPSFRDEAHGARRMEQSRAFCMRYKFLPAPVADETQSAIRSHVGLKAAHALSLAPVPS
jgi:hypothetical protein